MNEQFVFPQLKPKGNQELVEYGVQTESSDYRAHVAYKVQYLYVFPTLDAITAMRESNLEPRTASVDGQTVTARGVPMPIGMIPNIQEIKIPLDVYYKYTIRRSDNPTTKGKKAVEITLAMLKRGLVTLPLQIIRPDYELNVQGADIIVQCKLRIQVKCDYKAGNKDYGGTGNLYLQTHECNPYKFY